MKLILVASTILLILASTVESAVVKTNRSTPNNLISQTINGVPIPVIIREQRRQAEQSRQQNAAWEIRKKEIQKLLAEADSVVARNPQKAESYYKRADLKYWIANDVQGALADYTQAIALNPKYAAAYTDRGIVKSRGDDIEGGLADFSQAIAVDPKYARAYWYRGNLTIQKSENYMEAIRDFSRAIAVNPKYADAYMSRGLARLKIYEGEESVPDFQNALALYRHQGNTEMAQKAAEYLEYAQGTGYLWR
jgi:tetratricopeptide (TPR) repeat protein